MKEITASALCFLAAACGPQRFFYYPNNVLYVDPITLGMPYTMVNYESRNGKKLHAILFETKGEPKGTVVHFHGNFGNVSNHFTGSQFLTNYGFDVMVFDYQGYGGSEGRPTPKRTIEDGLATIQYAVDHARSPNKSVVIIGQSLGAAVGTVVAAKDPQVKAIVLEAGFASYRSMVRVVLAKNFFLWPLYPIYPFFMSARYDPEKYIDLISPRPVLLIHGDQDRIVPKKMSDRLFARAKEPKRLWIIPGAGHLECRAKLGEIYEKEVADFFANALQNNPRTQFPSP